MKKLLFSILALTAIVGTSSAQSIIDAQDGRNPNDFYEQGLVTGKKAQPFQFLRESDVVWRRTIWRTIDLNEAFNQFMYYPTNPESSTQGRINLVNLIVNAASNGMFDVYEDDDMKVPIEWEKAYKDLAGQEYSRIKTGEIDEDDAEVYKDTVMTGEPDLLTFKEVKLKEYWYIDKQDTRQKVRITSLAFHFTKNTVQAGTEVLVPSDSFWIPMDDMRVRNVLVNANAFEENNEVAEHSYDEIFISRYFDSYITRETNRFNRTIDSYLTGEDAILQSQMIEEEIFNIESDMWEY